MNCHQCQQDLASDTNYRFCPYCGTQLAAPSAGSNTIPDAGDTITVPALTAETTDADEPPTGKKKRSFSETAWFMASALPEELDDATPENYADIDTMTEPYEQSGKLPSPVRKEFSLSETGQHKTTVDDETNN
jgi:hypothetical protein